MTQHVYSRELEAVARGKRYPEDVAEEFAAEAGEAGKATDGSGLVEVTVDGQAVAAIVPLDLVEYALRHGWGR